MDDSTPPSHSDITYHDNTTTLNINSNDDHDQYAYKNEVSLSIGVEPSTSSSSAPTPSPRLQSEVINPSSNMEEIPLRPKSANDDKMGFDNPGFEQDTKRPLSSFGQNGQNNNNNNNINDTTLGRKTTNGKSSEKPLVEAVNLELVNIKKPINGHDKGNGASTKTETEVHIGDPYDEYFVPVNEHRKYMSVSFENVYGSSGVDNRGHSVNETVPGAVDYRKWTKLSRGEKLYVTKDKRVKSKWRKWLCWAIGLALIIGVIIVGILSATGVILSSEPTPVESRQFSDKEQIKSAGIFGTGGSESSTYPSSPEPPISTVPAHPPTTAENMVYIPNTLDGQITLMNEEFIDEYNDHNSSNYKKFSTQLEDEIKEALTYDNFREINVKVMDLKAGSVVVDYRVGWQENSDEPDFTEETMKETLNNYLSTKDGYLSKYLVPEATIRVEKLPDACAMNTLSFECEDGCKYNHDEFDFVCLCKPGMEFDKMDRVCREKKNDDLFQVHEVAVTKEHDHDLTHNHEHDHYSSYVSKAEPEPKSEPEPEPKSEPEPEPEPKSEPKPEPETESGEVSDSDYTHYNNHGQYYGHNHDHELDHDHDHESQPEPKSEPESSTETEPKSEAESNTEPKSKSIPEPEPKSEPEPESKPEPEPKSEPEPESKTESEPKSEPEPEAKPEPVPEPTSEPEVKFKSDDNAKYDIEQHHYHIEHIGGSDASKEQTNEPRPTTVSGMPIYTHIDNDFGDTEPRHHSSDYSEDDWHQGFDIIEPETDTTFEPEIEPEPKSEPEPSSKSQPSNEPEPASEPEPTRIPEQTKNQQPYAESELTTKSEFSSEQKSTTNAIISTDDQEVMINKPYLVNAYTENSTQSLSSSNKLGDFNDRETTSEHPAVDIESSKEEDNIKTLSDRRLDNVTESYIRVIPVMEHQNDKDDEDDEDQTTVTENILMEDRIHTNGNALWKESETETTIEPESIKESGNLYNSDSSSKQDQLSEPKQTNQAINNETTTAGPTTENYIFHYKEASTSTDTVIYAKPNNNQWDEDLDRFFLKRVDPETTIKPEIDQPWENKESTPATQPTITFSRDNDERQDKNEENSTKYETLPTRGDLNPIFNPILIIKEDETESTTIIPLDVPAPVTENIDDTPMPFMTYFKQPRLDDNFKNNDVNILDGVIKAREENITIYSTHSPIPIQIQNVTETEHVDMSPFLPIIETTSSKSMYAVTENITEVEQALNPFLPESENNATLINILHQGHDVDSVTEHNTVTKEDFKQLKKSPRLDNDENHSENPVEKNFSHDHVDAVIDEETVLKKVPLPFYETTTADVNENSVDDTTIPMTTEDNKYKKNTYAIISKDHDGDDDDDNETTTLSGNVEISTKSDDKESTTIEENVFSNEITKSEAKQTTIGEPTTSSSTIGLPKTTAPSIILTTSEFQKTSATDNLNEIYDSRLSENNEKYNNEENDIINANDLRVIPLVKYNEKKTAELHKLNTVEETTFENVSETTKLFVETPVTTPETSIINVNSSTTNSMFLDDESESMETSTESENVENNNDAEKVVMQIESVVMENKTSSRNLDDGNTVLFSKCTAGQFECSNGTSIKDGSSCINLNERCDAIAHCSDNSDELDCERLGCPGHFQCKDGPCLARHLVCDGIAHCNDSSDEIECDSWQCRFDEISCGLNNDKSHGPCLPSLWQCDGMQQCPNAADESNCPDTCSNTEFYCTTQKRCIPEAWRCDGKIDCTGGEDERPCDCPPNYFKCNTGGCVPQESVCDRTPQCPDLSDEWSCIKIGSKLQNANSTLNVNLTNENEDELTDVQKNLLQLKQSNGKFAYVCADEFTLTTADKMCQRLGFARSQSWSSLRAYPNDSDVFLYKNRTLTRSCQEGVVSLKCFEFECGTKSSPRSRITDGGDVSSEQWPSLALAYSGNSGMKCTSTILAPRWALASYSCIIGRTEFINGRGAELNWTLFTGSTLFDEKTNISSSAEIQKVHVKQIVVYPQAKYKRFMYTGDFVLLELENSLKFTPTVSSGCLTENPIEDGKVCMTAGWGVQKPGESNKEQSLKYLEIPTVPNIECNSTKYFNGALFENTICGDFSNDKTACYNDEGAPLLCFSPTSNVWEIQGVLSYHGNCGRRPQPVIYNSLSQKIIYWIKNTIGNENMFIKT